MAREAVLLLWDVRDAAARIARFVAGRSVEEYRADEMLRSAVERQCEIIGEALARLAREAPEVAARIPELRQAIGFRNVLIHGYEQIESDAVWRTATRSVPVLADRVAALLTELGPPA